MIFSRYIILVDDDFILKEDIDRFMDIGFYRFEHKDKYYEVNPFFLENRFWFIYIKYDKNSYNDEVWDTNDDKVKLNPKTRQQIEFREQLFICYDLQEKFLYSNKNNFIEIMKKLIYDNMGKECCIKSVISDLKEFKLKVSEITKLTFTKARNLVTIEEGYDDMFQIPPFNKYGLDLPDKHIMEYNNVPLKNDKNYISKILDFMKNDKDSGKFENVVIIGKGTDDEIINFDFNNLKLKIIIKDITKNEDGMYNYDEVLESLLSKIKKMKE